jgi:hypothetical protein
MSRRGHHPPKVIKARDLFFDIQNPPKICNQNILKCAQGNVETAGDKIFLNKISKDSAPVFDGVPLTVYSLSLVFLLRNLSAVGLRLHLKVFFEFVASLSFDRVNKRRGISRRVKEIDS